MCVRSPLERCAARLLEGEPAVLGEELQVLQIIFLNVLREVVDLHRGQHRAEGEDGRAVSHRRLAVEGALGIHEDNGHLFTVRKRRREHLGPHEDTRGVALAATSPREAAQRVAVTAQPLVCVFFKDVLLRKIGKVSAISDVYN